MPRNMQFSQLTPAEEETSYLNNSTRLCPRLQSVKATALSMANYWNDGTGLQIEMKWLIGRLHTKFKWVGVKQTDFYDLNWWENASFSTPFGLRPFVPQSSL